MKRKRTFKLSTTHIVLLSFLAVILLGSALLALPISTQSGESVSYLDALFTATTATCVTGLVTVTTATTWSVFGQIVILLLIQIGGLGVITVFAGFLLMLQKKMTFRNSILIGDAFNLNTLAGLGDFVRRVICGTLLIEGIGALLYMTVFVPALGARGIWVSVFNAVSAFCNAGIDIIGTSSLCDYATHPLINIVTALLIILGGLGYIVWWDLLRVIKKCKQQRLRAFSGLTLHSKIALCSTAALILGGAVGILALEYNNPATMQGLSFFDKLQLSLFQSVTVRTAGFASIPQENLTDATALLSMLLMFVGGSPVGTAGGVKTVTVVILVATAYASIRNKNEVTLFHRSLSGSAVRKAVAVVATSFAIAFLSALLLLAVTDAPVMAVFYEAVSATATVGLSQNLTPFLNVWGKIIIIITMYLGRVGPISLALALNTAAENPNNIKNPTEEISVG